MRSRWAVRVAALTLGLLGPWLCWSAWGVGAKAAPARHPELRLRISDNGRFLVDQKGSPFLVVGDSPWSLIVQLHDKDREIYLADREKKGFNSIIVNLLEHKFCTSPPKTRLGLAPFKTPGDFSTPNEAYFDFAHRVIEQAGKRGIVVWLAPAYLGYGGGDEGFFKEIKSGGRDKLIAYGNFVGRRFRDLPNLVWLLGGDYTPGPADKWVVTDLARAIRQEDPGHLMAAHHSPESSAVAAFGDPDWLNINDVYAYEKTLFHPLLAEYQRPRVRPLVLLETTYEGEHNSTPDQIRRQAYWAMLSGACGQFFGNNPIWHFDGPGLFPVSMTWQQALNAPGSRDMALLRRLFVQLPWQQLEPEQTHEIVTEGFGSDTATALAAKTVDGKLSVTYIPSTGTDQRELRVDLTQFPKRVAARWYNPTNGRFVQIEGSPLSNRASQLLTTPGNNGTATNDWLLVLEAR